MKKRIVLVSGVVGASLFVIASIWGGLQIDGYIFISQYISESYASGIPDSGLLQKFYIASGLLLAIFGFSAPFNFKSTKAIKIGFFLFAFFYGLGTVSTGFFPCDFGCPTDGDVSVSQVIHNASGFLVYAIVPFCLIGIGIASKKQTYLIKLSKVSLIYGVLALVFVVFLFGNPQGPFRGLIQRIIEVSILFWVVFTAFYIQRNQNP